MLVPLGGKDGIFNKKNKTSTTTLTSTNRNDDVADRSKRMVRDAQKRREEETRVTSAKLYRRGLGSGWWGQTRRLQELTGM